MILNNIFQNEIEATLTSLLSLEEPKTTLGFVDIADIPSEVEYIETKNSFIYSTVNAPAKFLIPSSDGFVIEHKMLGETDEIKTEVDDNLFDALKEITSNITGTIANSINAQDDEDLKDVKITVEDIAKIDTIDSEGFTGALKVIIEASNGSFTLYLLINNILSNYFTDDRTQSTVALSSDTISADTTPGRSKGVADIINDDEVENLKLLLGIELRLRVRLGSKKMLLKDIVNLDLGNIIELDQLVNEPLDILINDIKIAEGEAVVVDGKFAVKVKNIGSVKERVSYLRSAN